MSVYGQLGRSQSGSLVGPPTDVGWLVNPIKNPINLINYTFLYIYIHKYIYIYM